MCKDLLQPEIVGEIMLLVEEVMAQREKEKGDRLSEWER